MPRLVRKTTRTRTYVRKVGRMGGYTLGGRINRYKYMKYRRNRTGYIKIIRKLPEIAYSNSNVAGIGTVTDPTGTCLNATILGSTIGSVAANNLYDIGFSLNFRLDQVINSADITALVDKYKIKGAYVRVYYNNSNSSSSTQGGMPLVQYITDHDDKLVPLSQNSLREKMGVKFKTFQNASSYIGMKCRPVPNKTVFATGILNGYEVPSRPVWLDAANTNIEHYGIKGILSSVYLPANTSAASLFKFDIALVIEGKDFQ